MMAAVVRVLLPVVTVSVVGFAAGARLTDGLLGLVTLFVAAEGFALIAGLWGPGCVAHRVKNQKSSALIQVGIFVTMFLPVGRRPSTCRRAGCPRRPPQPLTYIIDMARAGFIGPVTWATSGPACWPSRRPGGVRDGA